MKYGVLCNGGMRKLVLMCIISLLSFKACFKILAMFQPGSVTVVKFVMFFRLKDSRGGGEVKECVCMKKEREEEEGKKWGRRGLNRNPPALYSLGFLLF